MFLIIVKMNKIFLTIFWILVLVFGYNLTLNAEEADITKSKTGIQGFNNIPSDWYIAKKKSIYKKDFERSERLKFKNARDFWEKDENIKSATREFEEYLELYPNGKNSLKAHGYLIRLYRIKREYQKALNLYNRLFQKYPDSRIGAEAKLESCRLYSLIGNEYKSKKCFQIILEEFVNFEDLYRQAKMELYLMEGQFIEPKKPQSPKDPSIEDPDIKEPINPKIDN